MLRLVFHDSYKMFPGVVYSRSTACLHVLVVHLKQDAPDLLLTAIQISSPTWNSSQLFRDCLTHTGFSMQAAHASGTDASRTTPAASQVQRLLVDSAAPLEIESLQDRSDIPDYTQPGPLRPMRLPRLEHTCHKCFPACYVNGCMLRVDVWYPKGGSLLGLTPTYPLAIFSSGFLVKSAAYESYARVLASWGYTVMLYDKVESALKSIDDEVSMALVSVSPLQLDPLCWCIAPVHRHQQGLQGRIAVGLL
jgi:hypothetical protein